MFPTNQTRPEECSSKNRIVIYSGPGGDPVNVICPSMRFKQDGEVKIFSQNLSGDSTRSHRHQSWSHDDTPNDESSDDIDDADNELIPTWTMPLARNQSQTPILVEFIAIQSGSYQLKWLELTQAVFNPVGSVVPLGRFRLVISVDINMANSIF